MNVAERVPVLSVIIPAYNAAGFVRKALRSIYAGLDQVELAKLEVLLVNDGSNDSTELERVVADFPAVRLLNHPNNRGMCAARNTGIAASCGEFVTLLDADDEFITGWYGVFGEIIADWPPQTQVCYTPCLNDADELTCSKPGYCGWLTAEDMARENLSGEYNPVFRGDYIRRSGYVDLGTRKSCGLLSYLQMAREAPFWITNKVMRRYHDAVEQSVTRGWTRPDKAAETYNCFSSVLAEHGDFIRSVAPEKHLQLRQKILIYRMLSSQGRDFAECWRSRSWNTSWFATLALLLLGPANSAKLLGLAKRTGLLRRYG